MLIQLNFKSGKPVYLQVVDQVKAAAASGALRTGEPLPSIRPLAEQLRINRNTVAKAYTELEGQGVIETIAGRPWAAPLLCRAVAAAACIRSIPAAARRARAGDRRWGGHCPSA